MKTKTLSTALDLVKAHLQRSAAEWIDNPRELKADIFSMDRDGDKNGFALILPLNEIWITPPRVEFMVYIFNKNHCIQKISLLVTSMHGKNYRVNFHLRAKMFASFSPNVSLEKRLRLCSASATVA